MAKTKGKGAKKAAKNKKKQADARRGKKAALAVKQAQKGDPTLDRDEAHAIATGQTSGKTSKDDKKGKKSKKGNDKKSKKGKKDKQEGKVVKARVDPAASAAVKHAAPEVYDTPVDVEPVAKKLRPDQPMSEVLRVRRGFVLADFDPASTPGFDEGRKEGEEALAAYAPEIGEWQERLFAETKGGGARSVLLVLQGLEPADVAQLVERNLAKVEVASSSLVVRSEVDRPTVEWPRGEAAACKAAYTGSNPVSTSVPQVGTERPRAISAVVARFLDTEEVTGSNPVSPTSTKRPLTCGNAARAPWFGPWRRATPARWSGGSRRALRRPGPCW
jgi:hypothetical protein